MIVAFVPKKKIHFIAVFILEAVLNIYTCICITIFISVAAMYSFENPYFDILVHKLFNTNRFMLVAK